MTRVDKSNDELIILYSHPQLGKVKMPGVILFFLPFVQEFFLLFILMLVIYSSNWVVRISVMSEKPNCLTSLFCSLNIRSSLLGTEQS